jgi:hypothetical protein
LIRTPFFVRYQHPALTVYIFAAPSPRRDPSAVGRRSRSIEGRAKWLQAAANIFDLIYKGSGQISVLARFDEKKD